MSRFDYDVVFYRVFCITLLVTAFTFTVILTNVFIDIDGLLSNKEKYVPEISETPDKIVNEVHNSSPIEEAKMQVSTEDDNDDSERESPSYRTKRSIDSESVIHANNPAMKQMLTSRLANLLEQLDEEAIKEKIVEHTTVKQDKKVNDRNNKQEMRSEDLLHLAMHNILYQGLIGHMDLNDVYKKVHILVEKFNKNTDSTDEKVKKAKIIKDIIDSKELSRESRYNEEHKFFEEIVKCKDLEDHIKQNKKHHQNNTSNGISILKRRDKGVFIKATIEINDNNDTLAINNKNKSKQNVEGLIKLIYNGKSVVINQMEQDPKGIALNESNTGHLEEQMSSLNKNELKENAQINKAIINNTYNYNQKPLFDKVIEEYFKKLSFPNFKVLRNSEEIESINTHRLKRQIKIRYSDDVTTSKTKLSDDSKKDDDDLYIEIETHFDGKGIKGEKKKKLLRNLIDKIQKALHSDIQEKRDDIEHIKFVKRSQDPIIIRKKATYLNTMSSYTPVEKRQVDPLGKNFKSNENMHAIEKTWKKQVSGPSFLTASKSVNSAEMRELNIDYDSILKNGMSKRLQKPLNTDLEDSEDNNKLIDTNKNNVTLFLKNIDGTGFSIGFNQYVGEPPDGESMKMFNNVESLIREYHRTYDQEVSNESTNNIVNNFGEGDHGVAKRNVKNIHKVFRRSLTKIGPSYHNNKYLMFLQKYIPFKNYPNVFSRSKDVYSYTLKKNNPQNYKTAVITPSKKNIIREMPMGNKDQNIHTKEINNSEILTAPTNFYRNKRSINVKKISSLKSKIKLNRYLNTKTMANKKIFLKNKRNKRQINKIRIIAKDKAQASPLQSSDENIFIISRENSYTDKGTIISDIKLPDTILENRSYIQDEGETPFTNVYKMQNSSLQSVLTENYYNDDIRTNLLMSKYPHIIVNEHLWSKEEEYVNDQKVFKTNTNEYRIQPISEQNDILQEVEISTEIPRPISRDVGMPKVEEIVNAIMPPLINTNYKVTLKISPKNKTHINAGFKEVHTSVNKSFDENGLRYFSLLNVSQISKVEKLNKTESNQGLNKKIQLDDLLKKQKNELKNLLSLHKKRVDVQLISLLRESNYLDKVIESHSNNNTNKTPKVLINSAIIPKPAQNEKSNFGSGSEKFIANYKMTSKNISTSMTTSKSTAQLGTTTQVPKIDTDKLNLFDTIKRNEKNTIEILNKIDSNTNILKTFLQRFSKKFEFNKTINDASTHETPKSNGVEVKLDLTRDWKLIDKKDPFFDSNDFKNDTIPFVYAYQQNIPVKSRIPTQGLASIVYHGHIHTNSVKNIEHNEFTKASNLQSNHDVNFNNNRNQNNESIFFIDDIEHPAMRNNNQKIKANIKINTTSV